jgi:hypothetical protein
VPLSQPLLNGGNCFVYGHRDKLIGISIPGGVGVRQCQRCGDITPHQYVIYDLLVPGTLKKMKHATREQD